MNTALVIIEVVAITAIAIMAFMLKKK